MKKTTIAAFVSGALLFGTVGVFAGQYVATENPFPVKLNGNNVSLEGYNINDETYFKLRDIADTVGGFSVGFEDNTIQLTKDGYSVKDNNNNNSPAGYVFETPQPSVNQSLAIPTVAPTEEPIATHESGIIYPTAFTYYKEFYGITKITSFKIVSVDESYKNLNYMPIDLEIEGKAYEADSINMNMSCYDADGYLLGTPAIVENVTQGKEFKIRKSVYVPVDTIKIAFE